MRNISHFLNTPHFKILETLKEIKNMKLMLKWLGEDRFNKIIKELDG